jgi:hypothetical protein
MQRLFIIIVLISFSKTAFAEQYFWKCYDDMLMSETTNKIQSVERKKYKSANIYVDTNKPILKYWAAESRDLIKELNNNSPINATLSIKKILINDDMIVSVHKINKNKYPDEHNVFTMDLKNKRDSCYCRW